MDIKRKEEFYEWISYEWMEEESGVKKKPEEEAAHLRSVLFVVLW